MHKPCKPHKQGILEVSTAVRFSYPLLFKNTCLGVFLFIVI